MKQLQGPPARLMLPQPEPHYSLSHAILLKSFAAVLFRFSFILSLCLEKGEIILLMRYFPVSGLPCDGNFHRESEQSEK